MRRAPSDPRSHGAPISAICNPPPTGIVEPPTGRPAAACPRGLVVQHLFHIVRRCAPARARRGNWIRRGRGAGVRRVAARHGLWRRRDDADRLAGPCGRTLSQGPRGRRHAGLSDALVLALGACAALCDLSRLPQSPRRALRPGDDVGRARRRLSGPSVRRDRQREMSLLSGGGRAHHRLRSHQCALGARLLHRRRGRKRWRIIPSAAAASPSAAPPRS